MPIDLTGITNENEFYTHHYLAAILEGGSEAPVRGVGKAGESAVGGLRALARPFQACAWS